MSELAQRVRHISDLEGDGAGCTAPGSAPVLQAAFADINIRKSWSGLLRETETYAENEFCRFVR
jgi:hypothetical protein